MSLIPHVRQQVIQTLWNKYLEECEEAHRIIDLLKNAPIVLDHFAIIDLPSKNSGISVLNQIFSALDYSPQGRDYLPEKQNEFMWLAPNDAENKKATDVLPQIVIADFCMDDLPSHIQEIIIRHADSRPAFPFREFHQLCGKSYRDDETASQKLIKLIVDYCYQQNFQQPTDTEYKTIKEFNELLAWVLKAGRKINHFGLQIHHLKTFTELASFNALLESALNISLNEDGGKIKGSLEKGILQSSTKSTTSKPFMEFVWRRSNKENPTLFKDYFTGFIGQQANKIIESVYESKET